LPKKTQVRVVEAYRGYTPPFDAAKTVGRLLATVPEKYLVGLDCIVLNNFSGLSRDHRLGKVTSRKRRIPKSRTLGFYRREWHGKPAYIELHVDKIADYLKRRGPLTWIPASRDMYFGLVLYHELGHHAHRVVRPEHREKEDVAHEWSKRFTANFIARRYWYAVPFLIMLRRAYKIISRVRIWRPRKA